MLAKRIRVFLEGDHQFCWSESKVGAERRWQEISDRNRQEKNMEKSIFFLKAITGFSDSDQGSERRRRSHWVEGKRFSAPFCHFGFSASSLRASRLGAHCGPADRGFRLPL